MKLKVSEICICTRNTNKNDKNIYILRKSKEVDAAQNIITLLQNFDSITENHPNCSLTLLEIPIYSIYESNKVANHPNAEVFNEQDIQLQRQIEQNNIV